MSSCDEVLDLIIAVHGVLEGKKLVSVVHTTESHVATELCDPY